MPSGENQNREMGGSRQARCTPEIRQTVELVQSQLAQLLQQRAAVVKRIAMIRRAIGGLNAMFADSEGGPAETAKGSIPKPNVLQSAPRMPDGSPEVRKTAHLA
jgi:hypothetical protein